MNKVAHWILICASGLLVSCNTSKSVSVRELKRIQDNDGVLSQSLYYCGSTRSNHYFEQDQPFEILLPWPWGGDGVDRYKVSQRELDMGKTRTFPRDEYEGDDDDKRRKIRIQEPDAATGRAAVKPRKESGERFRENHGKFDPSRLKITPEGEGVCRIEYD